MTKSSRVLVLGIALLVLAPLGAMAQEGVPRGPVYVSPPVVPTVSIAAKDLPDLPPNPNMLGQEMKRREDFGFIPIEYPIEPKVDPLLKLQEDAPGPSPEAFGTPLHNYTGMTSPSSPPDDTGDVGLTYFVQGINGSGSYSTSCVAAFNKSTGANAKTFSLQSLASSSPCNSGYCDPIVMYDRAANRWVLTEFPSSGGHLCVYVSTTSDPTGTYYAYAFMNVESSTPDYPKYGVWPQTSGGSYMIGINAGASGVHDVVALDRGKMLAGQPATYQKFTVPNEPNYGFQLVLPAHMQGTTPPPNGSPAIVMRPRDDEAQDGASTPTYDLMEMWAVSVDWTTPANSTITQLTSLHIGDYDCTMCGTGSTWNCMPQSGTTQKIDPIREPIHWPLQYRNFGDHEALVGCFVEDVDGTDHAALRWFEIRKTSGAWSLYQEGVIGGEANVHRSVGSASIDQSGNIAVGYTRTGTSLYPSIYYKGRLSTDPLGTMPQGEYVIQDATTSKTDNERWGDYAGMNVDPSDDCTFWFTTEYGGSGDTKIAAMKFDACGCLSVPAAPTASASVPQNNRIDVGWNDSATATITQYWVYRSTVTGGPYTQIATVTDSSPGVGGGTGYTYHDDTVSGGTRYYYVVKSNDGAACTSAYSTEVNALATGACTLAPTFAGLTSVTNAASSTCTLNLSWSAGTALCTGPVRYNVYRSTTTGFTPGPANRIAQNYNGASYQDLDQLTSGTTYYYVVRAVDSSNSSEETNVVEKSGAPTGTMSLGTFFAGAETGNPAMTMNAPWAASTTYKRTGTSSYSTGATYPNSACGGLTTPSLLLGTSSVLTFYHIYSTETGWDGGRVEISTNGGSTWTALTPTPAYPGTMSYSSNACSWAVGTSCYIGNSTGYPTTWQLATINLGPTYDGQTVLLRWNFTSDSSGAGTGTSPGWYIDDINLTNVNVPGTCATGSACANNPTSVSVTPDGPLTLCTGTGQLLTASPSGGSGLTYQWYRDGAVISGATSSTYTANDTANHTYNCQVKGTGCSTAMSDGTATSITWQSAPTFAGLTSLVNPQNATCTLNLGWSAGSSPCGAVTYNVYRSTTGGFTPGPANRVAAGVATTSYNDATGLTNGTTYYYVVRAQAGGTEETNLTQMSGAPTGTITTTTPFTEAFDSVTAPALPSGWATAQVSGTAGAWATSAGTVHPSGGGTHSGANVAYFNSYTAAASSATRLYRNTAGFSLSGATGASLSFWMYHDTGYSTDNDNVQVQISVNAGSTWTNYGAAVARYSATAGWAQHTVDLAAAIGQTDVRIAFVGTSAYGNDCHIDDVSVSKQTAVSCSAGSSASPRVPYSVTPSKMTTANHGTDGSVTWDIGNCASTNYHVLYGKGENLSAWTVDGGKCSIGTSGTYGWTSVPDPSSYTSRFLWWLVVGDNGSGTEGSWGQTSAGAERGGTNASGLACGTVKDTSATCGTP